MGTRSPDHCATDVLPDGAASSPVPARIARRVCRGKNPLLGARATRPSSILNPINRTRTRAGVHRYKVEPYVVAADVYAEPPHVGRGGWTWYTGSAGWMYRAALESILGVRLRGATLHLDPCIPGAWPSYEISLRYQAARYTIRVENPRRATRGISAMEVDGVLQAAAAAGIPLADDGLIHHVRVVLGNPPEPHG